MTSDASEKKEIKMIEFKTNIPALDKENAVLFKASALLEKMGNSPGLSANDFYKALAKSEMDTEEFEALTLAAISIETMMGFDAVSDEFQEPTIH